MFKIKSFLLIVLGMALGLAFLVPSDVGAAGKQYDYQLVSQSSYPVTLNRGEITTVSITLKNTGTATWYDKGIGAFRLGSGSSYGAMNQQRDYSSEFYDSSSWLSNNRPTALSSGPGLLPGSTTTLTFDLKTPSTPGIFKAYFTPVIDGVTWMKDIGIYWKITVTGDGNTVYLNENDNGGTNAAIIGTVYKINLPGFYGDNPTYDHSVLRYTPDYNCTAGNECVTVPWKTNTFEVIGNGYSGIDFDVLAVGGMDQSVEYRFFINIVSEYTSHIYDGSMPSTLLQNSKNGDIIIVNLGNLGDGGYIFDDPEFPIGRVKLIDHKHFSAVSGLTGDFGSDQWAFQILDSNPSNYIQIRAYRPWAGGDSFTSFYLDINPQLYSE